LTFEKFVNIVPNVHSVHKKMEMINQKSKIKNLYVYIFLLISTFLSAFVLGMMQFFMLEHLVAQRGEEARAWLIQFISAVITIGPVFVYIVSGPLSAAVKKRWVMSGSLLCAAGIILFGGMTNWFFTPWFYLATVGLLLGIFSAAKMASVPLASVTINRSTTFVNAGMTIAFLLGILMGLPCGTFAYNNFPEQGWIVGLTILFLSGIAGSFCKFTVENKSSFISEEKKLVKQTGYLFKTYWLYLASSPVLWGVAGATNMAVTALVVKKGTATPQQAAFISLWAAIGIVGGNALSPMMNKIRFKCSAAGAFLMILCVALFPVATTSYMLTIALVIVLGVFFGIAANLIESAYYHEIGKEGKESSGAALSSACVAFFTVATSLTVALALQKELVSPHTQFVIIIFVICLPMIFSLILNKITTKDILFSRKG